MTAIHRELDDAAAERLLRGHAVDGAPELAALVAGLGRLQDLPPAPRGALTALLAEGFDPAAAPVPAADVPVWSPAPLRTGLLRSPAVRLAGLSLLAKVALGTGAAVAAVGSAGGAGLLPGALQDRVAGIVSTLTPFELPRSSSDPAPAEPTPPEDPPPGAVVPQAPVDRPAPPVPPAVQPPLAPPVPPAPAGAPERPLPPSRQEPAAPAPAAPAPAGQEPADRPPQGPPQQPGDQQAPPQQPPAPGPPAGRPAAPSSDEPPAGDPAPAPAGPSEGALRASGPGLS